MNINKLFILAILLFFSKELKAEGQEGLGLVLDIIYFLKVFFIGLTLTGTSIFIANKIKSDLIKKRGKLIIWMISVSLTLTYWSTTKYNAYPFGRPYNSAANKRTDGDQLKSERRIEYSFEDSSVYIFSDKGKERIRSMTEEEVQSYTIDEDLTNRLLMKNE